MLSREAAPLADLAIVVAASNGVKTKDMDASAFNRYAQQLIVLEAKDAIPPRSAKIFLKLLKEEELPSWIGSALDIDLIRAAAS
jgi:hypothetical protein